MRTKTPPSASGRPYELVPIALVLATGLALAVTAFVFLRGHFEMRERQRFQRDAARISVLFTEAIERHVHSLGSIRAFVSASRSVTRWEFSTFAKQTLPGNPGFAAFFWVPVIGAEERARYEAELQKDGLYQLRIREPGPDGQLRPAGERPDYRPVSYVEPFAANGVSVALDLSQQPVYRALFEAADKSGEVAVSGPIDRSILDEQSGPSVLVAFPLLAPETRSAATSVTPGTTRGYAIGVLRFARILDAMNEKGGASVDIAIAYDEAAFARRIIYSSVGHANAGHGLADWMRNGEFRQETAFAVAGQHFILGLRSPIQPALSPRLLEPVGAAFLILALAGLLAQHLYTTVTAKRRVERAVILRTAALHNANAALEEEIEQRRKVEIDLRAAKDKAESANRAKSEFLATMSHELRTPLNAIIGFSSLLTQEDMARVADKRIDDYVSHIHEGGIRLLTLINGLLELSQMDAGRMQLEEEPVDIADLVRAASRKSDPETKGVALRTDIPAELPCLRADPPRLEKALCHLLSNAVKFTGADGKVKVSALQNPDGSVSLSVSDNGIGIPKGQETRVFEPFVQLDSALSRTHDGAGLGLAYVKRVAELHNAHLTIASKLGSGTNITLTFPSSRVVKNAEVA